MHAATGKLLRYDWVVGQQVRQTDTGSSSVVTQLRPDVGLNGTKRETYQVTTTQIIRKIYPDGSGLMRSTFSSVSITINGKKKVYDLKGYALDQRISTRGAILSQKIAGTSPNLSDLPSQVTNPGPLIYPAAAVHVGSTWHAMPSSNGASVTGADTGAGLEPNVRVLAFRSVGGRLTVTLGLSLHQRLYAITSPISGLLTGTGTLSLFVATGAPAAPEHVVFAFHGTVAGAIYGKQTRGTYDATVHETVNPMP